ncbi:hypothetical protein H9R64_10850 [Klebsiella pneumoniae]|uniref:hypothetical protein n=1 Tax=Klebsiella pneumoniae TaxID=573 RepID=UPI00192CD538|nr:hypothetical protein [Klebsiella pneumoniae]MBL4465951.1 hypothetical protein [Klebsiella pneumoniae]
MQRFTDAIRKSVKNENWFAALFLALAMPDICAQTEKPSGKNSKDKGRKYRDWYKRYLNSSYVTKNAYGQDEGFTGSDCWSFRCACLHSGLGAEARGRVQEWAFRPPLKIPGFHVDVVTMQFNGKTTLQIDLFAENVCLAVEQWERDMSKNPDVVKRITELIYIDDRHNDGFAW